MIPSDVMIARETARCEKIVQEEWAEYVKAYKPRPSIPEGVIERILNRIRRAE